jgi:hypothetical protein
MYIMTHFLKNVLTFLFQYDIYISAFAQATVLGQKLPFSLSELLSGRRDRCIISITTTRLPLTDAAHIPAVGVSLRLEGTISVSSSGSCSIGVTPPSKGTSLSARTTACLAEAKGAHRKSLAELAQPG